jgi:hypothetical protein
MLRLTSNNMHYFEKELSFIHIFIHRASIVQDVCANVKPRSSKGRSDVAVRCSTRW